jgi:hypothetical protein
MLGLPSIRRLNKLVQIAKTNEAAGHHGVDSTVLLSFIWQAEICGISLKGRRLRTDSKQEQARKQGRNDSGKQKPADPATPVPVRGYADYDR